jgi:hypothetical protein
MSRYAGFTIALSSVPAATVTVGYTTTNGSALANVDYRPRSGTLTFPPGVQTQTVWVKIRDPNPAIPARVFYVDISSGTGATVYRTRGAFTIPADTVENIDLGTLDLGDSYSGSPLTPPPVGSSYSFSSGTSPPGIFISGSGVISGSPTELGTYNWYMKSSGANPTTYKRLTLEVTGDPIEDSAYTDEVGTSAYADETGEHYVDGT